MAQAQEVLPLSVTLQGIAATELRPWGSFTILEEARGYKIKRIEVKPGHRLSLQMHHHRSETSYLLLWYALVCDKVNVIPALHR